MRKNILSCKQVTKILNSEAKFPFGTRLKLNLHLLICQCCTDYKTQMKFISKEAKKIYDIKLNQQQELQLQKIKEQVIKNHSKY